MLQGFRILIVQSETKLVWITLIPIQTPTTLSNKNRHARGEVGPGELGGGIRVGIGVRPTQNIVLDHDPSVIKLGCDDYATPDSETNATSEIVQKKSILRGHSGPVYDICYTARGRYLMSVRCEDFAKSWKLFGNQIEYS